MLDVVRATAERVFLPLTVGGGVRSVEDVRELLLAGADKVGINTAAVADPELVRRAADAFGNQAIVVAVDARRIARRRAAGLGGLHARRPAPDRPGRDRLVREDGGLRARAKSCSPAWTATGRATGSTSS